MTQDLAAMAVAMRQQHEGEHAGIGDLQDHAGVVLASWLSSERLWTTTFSAGSAALGAAA
jgi:hypothetical protein